MPDALELPRMLIAVVELMGSEGCPRLYPSLAAVVGALNDLPKPAAALRGKDAIRIDRGPLQVVHLPAGKMRTTDVPLFAFSVGAQNECALPCSHQYSYLAHLPPLTGF